MTRLFKQFKHMFNHNYVPMQQYSMHRKNTLCLNDQIKPTGD